MNDECLLRYSRHILLDEIGFDGQEKLAQSRILLVGLGGLGSAVALYLASSGLALNLVDFDTVDLSNLQRQIVHNMDSLKQNKADSAQKSLKKINPLGDFQIFKEKISFENAAPLLHNCQLIADCSDNFQTRYLLNRLALENNKILVSSSAIRWGGQLLALDFQQQNMPCYACLFPENANSDHESCATSGVFAPLVGVMGSLQAALILKMLLQLETPPFLMNVDLQTMRFHRSVLQKDKQCPVCGEGSCN